MNLNELFLKESLETFYHGSKTKISKFSFKHISSDGNRQLEGPGIYFTTNKEDAAMYGGYLHAVTVDMSKGKLIPKKKKFSTLDIQKLIKESPVGVESVNDNWGENPTKAMKDACAAVMDSWGPDEYFDMATQVWADYYDGENEAWLDAMVKRDYIGHRVEREGGDHFILYNLDAIKSIEVTELD